MPLSPFTRIFGLAIVAAYFLAVLWPDESAALWGWQTMIALPIVIGLFSWSAVRDAPPFDDQAFHRVLPPGDGVAFRRVLMIHGMVLAGIAVAVIIYCRIYNFSGSAMAYGIAILTIPVWTLMAASGVANSLSTSRQSGITWPYLGIFAIPALSAFLICWLRDHPDFADFRKSYRYRYPLREGLSTIAVAGAVLYPIIWWLVAVKRRRALGLGLAIATGLSIPWMYGAAMHRGPRDEPPVKSHVTITRKASVPADGKWIRVNETLSVDGLRKGEFADLDLSVNQNGLSAYEVPDDPAEVGVHQSSIIAGRFEDGTLSWGETAAWHHLRSQVPSLETFQFWWSQRESVPTHLAFLRPGKTALFGGPYGDTSRKPASIRQKKTEAEFSSTKWDLWSPGVFIFEKAGEVDVSDGGTCKLPGGGILRVNPLKQEGKGSSISFRRYYEDPWQSGGEPWFGLKSPENRWTARPWVIAVDPTGKHAFALPSAFPVGQDQKVMLGQFMDYLLYTGEAKTADELARVEMLRHCRLHIFWPEWVAPLQREILPPQ